MKNIATLIFVVLFLFSCNNHVDEEQLCGMWYLNHIEVNNKKSRGGRIMLCPTLEIKEDHKFESIAHVIFRNGKWSTKNDSISFKYYYGQNNEIARDQFIVKKLTQNKLTLQKDSTVFYYARNCVEEN